MSAGACGISTYAIIQSRRISDALRDRRRALRIQPKRLARSIGVTPRAIKAWDYGERVPTLDHLLAYANAVGCDLVIEERPDGAR